MAWQNGIVHLREGIELDGADPFALYLKGNRALQEVDGKYQAVHAPGFDEGTFDACEGSELDADAVAAFEVGPRDGGLLRLYDSLYGGDFQLVNGFGDAALSYDGFDAGSGDDGDAMVGVQATKEVTGEEGDGDFFDAIGVAANVDGGGQEGFESFNGEGVLKFLFAFGADLEGVPREWGGECSRGSYHQSVVVEAYCVLLQCIALQGANKLPAGQGFMTSGDGYLLTGAWKFG